MEAAVPSVFRNVLIPNGNEALFLIDCSIDMAIPKLERPPSSQSKAPGTSGFNSDCDRGADRQQGPGAPAGTPLITRFLESFLPF